MLYKDYNNLDMGKNFQIQNCINIYNNVSLRLLNVKSLDEVINTIEEALYSTISPDFIDIFMKIDGVFSRIKSSNLDLYDSLFTIREPLPEIIEQLNVEKKVIFLEDFQSFDNLKADLNIFEYTGSRESIIFVPLNIKDNMGGFVILAFNNKIDYTRIYFDVLIGICNLVSLTIERMSYKEEQVLMKDILDRSEKLTSMGRIVAGVAHEINNPLSILQLDMDELIQKINKKNRSKDVNELLGSMQEEIIRISSIVKNLKDFYSPADDTIEVICPDDMIKDYPIKIMLKNIKKKNIKIKLNLKCSNKIRISKTRFLEIIMNILNNAIDAVEKNDSDESLICIETFCLNDRKMNVIKIKDNGCGIASVFRDKIFEPFFTTKKINGTGLGLSISYSIIKKYGGEIEVISKENEGTEFAIYFPNSDSDYVFGVS